MLVRGDDIDEITTGKIGVVGRKTNRCYSAWRKASNQKTISRVAKLLLSFSSEMKGTPVCVLDSVLWMNMC